MGIPGKPDEKGKIHLIWDELQRRLDEQGYSIKRGTIQDASSITSYSGHAPADKPREDDAKTRRSRNGIWARKGTKSEFGYKISFTYRQIIPVHPKIRYVHCITA